MGGAVNWLMTSLYLYGLVCTTFHVVTCVATNSNVYERTTNNSLKNTFISVTAPSMVACCGYCDQSPDCMSVSYKESSGLCQLSREPRVAVNVNGQTDPDWIVYSKRDWMLVFRALAGAGGDIYRGWINGTSVTDDVTCMTINSSSCTKHYRNPIVDVWDDIGMTQEIYSLYRKFYCTAKFAFYKDNVEVAYVIFNATGSDVSNWFHNTRITDSSWSTIKTDTFNFFSIAGDTTRRFYINRTYGGCPSDTGYAVVITEKFSCSYEDLSSYPQFMYASTSTYGTYETMTGMDMADVMAIFIK